MNHPWGNARAALLFRGVKLPARESVAEAMMNEMVSRERLEKIATWEATVSAIGFFLGHSEDAVKQVTGRLKGPLLERVTQESYNLRLIRRKLYARLQAHRGTLSHMDRLNEMTVK